MAMTYEQLMALKAKREALRKAAAEAQKKPVEPAINEEQPKEEAPKKGKKKKVQKEEEITPTRSFMTVEEGEEVYVNPAVITVEDMLESLKED